VFYVMCMIENPAIMILCLHAMNFHALCDGIIGLLFLMLFEKPLMLWYEYDGGLCVVWLFMAQSQVLGVQLGLKHVIVNGSS